MSYPQFFAESVMATANVMTAVLEPEEAHHIKVRRIKPGERICVSTQDMRYELSFEKLEDGILVGSDVQVLPEPERPRIALFQGVSKGERFDLVVRVATELGIPELYPLMSERCIVQIDSKQKAETKQRRWEAIAVAAAKQSGITRPMTVHDPIGFDAAVDAAKAYDLVIVAWEEAGRYSLHEAIAQAKPGASVALFIGPEGGFSFLEVDKLQDIGAQVITLGDTILRTETAGIVASALLSYELGGLGNRS